MLARAQRKRSWAAVLTQKIEDTLACLRGAVSGGAEKKQRILHFLRIIFGNPELPKKTSIVVIHDALKPFLFSPNALAISGNIFYSFRKDLVHSSRTTKV
jgi:hypothetical protein